MTDESTFVPGPWLDDSTPPHTREFYDALWGLVGKRISVVFEQAGNEFEYVGTVSCFADGRYAIGAVQFTPGYEGFLVRWTTTSSVQFEGSTTVREGRAQSEREVREVRVLLDETIRLRRPYDWEIDGECVGEVNA